MDRRDVEVRPLDELYIYDVEVRPLDELLEEGSDVEVRPLDELLLEESPRMEASSHWKTRICECASKH